MWAAAAHRGGEAKEGPRADGERLEDQAGDRAQEDGEQLPRLGVGGGGGGEAASEGGRAVRSPADEARAGPAAAAGVPKTAARRLCKRGRWSRRGGNRVVAQARGGMLCRARLHGHAGRAGDDEADDEANADGDGSRDELRAHGGLRG